jgi:hypothetical protein
MPTFSSDSLSLEHTRVIAKMVVVPPKFPAWVEQYQHGELALKTN